MNSQTWPVREACGPNKKLAKVCSKLVELNEILSRLGNFCGRI